jgi:hypothetical protein
MMDALTIPDYMVWGPCLDAPWWFQILHVISFTLSFAAGVFKIWTTLLPDAQYAQKSLEVDSCYADFVKS